MGVVVNTGHDLNLANVLDGVPLDIPWERLVSPDTLATGATLIVVVLFLRHMKIRDAQLERAQAATVASCHAVQREGHQVMREGHEVMRKTTEALGGVRTYLERINNGKS